MESDDSFDTEEMHEMEASIYEGICIMKGLKKDGFDQYKSY